MGEHHTTRVATTIDSHRATTQKDRGETNSITGNREVHGKMVPGQLPAPVTVAGIAKYGDRIVAGTPGIGHGLAVPGIGCTRFVIDRELLDLSQNVVEPHDTGNLGVSLARQ